MEEILSNLLEMWLAWLDQALVVGGSVIFSLAGLIPAAVAVYLIWLAVSAGQRRQERARCFVDLLGIGLGQGRTVEETIRTLAGERVTDLGVRFHLVAAWMEKGFRLGPALAEVPRFVPAQVRALLQVGERLGDLRRILPVCRASLGDGPSETQKNMNTLMALLFVSPVGPVLVWIIHIFVLPKFKDLIADMASDAPAGLAEAGVALWSSVPFTWSLVLANVILGLWLFFLAATSLRGLGSWMFDWATPAWGRLMDRVSLMLPWRSQRLLRDFTAVLGLLLDAGLVETEAVRLAADGTGNSSFQRRAQRLIEDLKQGVKLTEAVRWLDERGEFRWRLENACHGHAPNHFTAALAGWQESLSASAFQKEQLFSQALTTGFVLLNGVMVGLASVGMFSALTFITEVALW